MLTKDGRYFTGEKTYWHATPEKSGRVDQIEASVKAYDNEGRVFKGPIVSLTPSQVQRATVNTKAHLEVIAEMVRDLYETSCAAEVIPAKQVENEGPKDGKEGEAGQDRGHVEDAAVEGPGDVLAHG